MSNTWTSQLHALPASPPTPSAASRLRAVALAPGAQPEGVASRRERGSAGGAAEYGGHRGAGAEASQLSLLRLAVVRGQHTPAPAPAPHPRSLAARGGAGRGGKGREGAHGMAGPSCWMRLCRSRPLPRATPSVTRRPSVAPSWLEGQETASTIDTRGRRREGVMGGAHAMTPLTAARASEDAATAINAMIHVPASSRDESCCQHPHSQPGLGFRV
eukprot:3256055-Rhodomonas_salina.1